MRIRLVIGIMLLCAGSFAASPKPDGGPYTETVDGIAWTFMVSNCEASVGCPSSTAIPASTSGRVAIPTVLGGRPVTSVGAGAFYYSYSLTDVTVPIGVIRIGEYAFAGCSALTNVVISEGVKNIGACAFHYCSMEDIAIPSSVVEIGERVFYGCAFLQAIAVDKDNNFYSSQDGVLFNKEGTELIQFPQGKDGAYAIPSGVTCIRKWAFYYSVGLTGVNFPASLMQIGESAFLECRNMLTIEVDSSNDHFSSQDGVLFNKDGTELKLFPQGKAGSMPCHWVLRSLGHPRFTNAVI